VTTDYLIWWLRRGPVAVPLVTTGPVVTGDPITSSGPIGNPGTVSLVGDSGLDYGTLSGGRFTFDFGLPAGGPGVQVSGFVLERGAVGLSAASDAGGNPILARPIHDVLDQVSSAALVSYPGALAGGIAVVSRSRLWGLESNLTGPSWGDERRHARLLAGIRYLDLLESLDIAQRSTVLLPNSGFFNGSVLNPDDTLVLGDAFRTRNQFYGAQLGVEGERGAGRWVVAGQAKVALGAVHELVEVQGSSALIAAGATGIGEVAGGGVLALDTNIGRPREDRFAVLPEVSVKLGYRVTPRLLATVGYTFLYLSDVARPGNQIDPGVNVGHAPSSEAFGLLLDPRRPAPLFNHSEFWAQGLSVGLELHF
jgi:hypothetical protein